MTEKEYFEVHASQAEFLGLVPQASTPSVRKNRSGDCGYGSLLLCRRENETLS